MAVLAAAGRPEVTAAVVTLAVALAAALAAVAYLVYRLVRISPDLVAAGKRELAADERADHYREERDDAVRQLAVARQNESAALVRLKLAEQQRNAAAEEERKHVVERIKAARIGDAARIVDDLLSAPLSGVRQVGDAGADRDGGTAPDVQPAAPAATDGARRRAGSE